MLGVFLSQSGKDPVCCVSLLPRRISVFFQNPIDDLLQRAQTRLVLFEVFPLRRNRIGDRLPHHPAMHAVLLRQSLNRLSGRMTAPDLFE